MNIRDTVEDDAESLAALIDAVARERRFLAATVGFPVDGTRAFIAALREAGGTHLIAIEAGNIVGWCDIAPQLFEGMQHGGRLGMGIRSDCRAREIGGMLLDAAIEKAFAAGFERVELEVFASNLQALKLYESAGFQLEGRKIGARKLDGIVDDILLYAMQR